MVHAEVSLDSNRGTLSDNWRRHCLLTRSLFHTFKLLPAVVSIPQGTFHLETNPWKIALCLSTFGHLLIRTIFLNIRVSHGLFTCQYRVNSPHLLTWDIMTLLASNMYSFWYAVFFLWQSDVTMYSLAQVFSPAAEGKRGTKL